MIRKPLTCPICGDTWKRVVVENFVRLGPPTHECRACWTPFATGEKEWRNLDGSARASYFLQNIVIILPLCALLIVALGTSYFMDLIGRPDAKDYLIFGAKFLAGFFILLNLRSGLMILLSQRRVARKPSPKRQPTPKKPPEVPHYPQGRPNPRPEDPSEHRGWRL